MAAPWEKYRAAPAAQGPWAKYGGDTAIDYAKTPLANQIPGAEKSLDSTVNVGKDKSSLADKALGIGEAGLAGVSGLVGGAAGAATGLVKGVTGGKYGTRAGLQEADKTAGDVMRKVTYQPRTEKGQEYTGDLSSFASNVLAGIPASATSIPVKPGLSRAASAIANSPEGQMVGKGVTAGAQALGKVADKVVPNFAMKLSPEMQALNAKARSYGITLQPHQLTDNKFMKVIGETLNYVPASGAKNEKNRIAFETALVNQIGGEGKRLTPKVFDGAMRKSGTTIDAVTRKYSLAPSKEFVEKLADHVNEARKLETPDVSNSVAGWVDQVSGKMADGPMNGAAFRKLNTALGKKIRETTNGDLRTALSGLQDTLLEQFNAGITDPKDAALYKLARMQYAKAKTIAPIVGQPNGLSPQALLQQVRNTKAGKERYARGRGGDLGDLGDIGQLLKDPPTSLTSERGLAYGAVGSGLGGLVNPALVGPAVGVYGGANLYNRLGAYMYRPIPPKP